MVLALKYLAFVLLASVSGYRSILLFTGLSSSITGAIILGIMQGGLELVKVFSLLRIEYALYLRHTNNIMVRMRISYILYGALALYSMLASFGYSLSIVGQQVRVSEAEVVAVESIEQQQIDFFVASIAQIDTSIEQLQTQLANINPDFATGATRLSSQIQELQLRRQQLFGEQLAIQSQQITRITDTVADEALSPTRGSVDAYSMFTAMSRVIGFDTPEPMMIILLLFASILLEIGIVYTSPVINVSPKHRQEVLREAVSLPSSESQKRPAPKRAAKAIPPKKKAAAPTTPTKKKNSATAATITAVSATSADATVIAEQAPSKPIVPRRVTAEQIVRTLLSGEGKQLMPAADAATKLGISVDKVQKVISHLQNTKSSPPLITLQDGAYNTNYMKSFILTRLGYDVDNSKSKEKAGS